MSSDEPNMNMRTGHPPSSWHRPSSGTQKYLSAAKYLAGQVKGRLDEFSFGIRTVSVLDGGAGYTTAPAVTIEVAYASSNPLTPAELEAVVDPISQAITAINVPDPGEGYRGDFSIKGLCVLIMGGGGSGASAKVTSLITQVPTVVDEVGSVAAATRAICIMKIG